jgi:SAM-dependent methyltransferase
MGLAGPAVQTQADAVRACEICQNQAGNKIHSAREMMLGLRDVFQYLECQACGCLQLLNPPSDMARYYPAGYTAFCGNGPSRGALSQRIWRYARKRRNHGVLESESWFHQLLTRRCDDLPLRAFAGIGAGKNTRILDVGCGSGTLLVSLKEFGYKNLLGVDRFIPRSIDYGDGVTVIKGVLADLTGTSWDLVMFHHSFEHMPEPARVLQLTADLLAPGGHCLIRIPVVGWAWEHYGVHWAQLDAPRHLFLHTERSFRMLAGQAGLQVHDVTYDSTDLQFWVSELYSRNVDLASVDMTRPQKIFSKSEMRNFRVHAERLNAQGRGDSAVFKLLKL